MRYKEYGGYIELETQTGEEFHKDAIGLNCGRNCLAYLIEARGIQKIYLPYFLCASVEAICKKYHIETEYYHIDESFRPIFDVKLEDDEYLYLVNYYGQLSDAEIIMWKEKYSNMIVDYAQSYFQMPIKDVDTLYTCRKYFGVADGAYLYTSSKIQRDLEIDYSYDRMRFLLGRYEKGANEFYNEYVANNRSFREAPIFYMSELTHNLLRGICYENVKHQRTKNFEILDATLGEKNKLSLKVPQGAFMYPFYIENGEEVRKKLQVEKIYIPTLWSDVYDVCNKTDIEYDMARNILPIPVDQRYDKNDMEYLVKMIIQYTG